jgi:signal transduction histidine kinase
MPRELLNKISKQVKNISLIMNDFSSLSQIITDKAGLKREELNLAEFTKDFIQEGIVNFSYGQITISVSGKPKKISLDKTCMKMVLKNLIENAIKYSVDKTPVEIAVRFKPKMVQLSVTDYGIGVPDSEKDKLFQTFYRASNAEFIKGTGIGLSIVKEYVELQDGMVIFESEENKGSTFTISFPN